MPNPKQPTRRTFIKRAGALSTLVITAGITACSEKKKEITSTNINFNKTYRWKMTTTWPPNFPITGVGCKLFAEWVNKMSGGRMEITVYGAGELIPALEGFDAVSNGAVEMNHGAAYYWAGKLPAAPFFTAVPFGMNAQQIRAWITSGGGQELWDEVYAPFNLIGRMCGNTGFQMGGWFNKEINTVTDLQGLKMRIPGLGGKVLARVGGTPMLVSGGEIYTNLERGVLDATEWIGPYHDYLMGLHQVAKYYYYPGWHETGPALEMIFNRDKFNELPPDLREILITCCTRVDNWMYTQFDYQNGIYLKKMIEENGIQPRKFPREVMKSLKTASIEMLNELAGSDEQSKKVYESYESFREIVNPWMDISERTFYEDII